jgi:hypothetical protein
MSVHLIVVFLHVITVIVMLAAGGIAQTGLSHLRSATRVEQVRPWIVTLAGLKLIWPIGGIVLLATGGYLVRDGFSWRNGWVLWSLFGLLLAEGLGGSVNARAIRATGMAFARLPDGPLTTEARALLRLPRVHLSTSVIHGTVTGVIFTMIAKPAGIVAALAVLGGAAIGAILALRSARAENVSSA